MPRVASDGEIAKFLLRGGEQSWECEAEGDAGGGYRGSLTIPMVDEYSVYLVLTDQNGGTRNLLIASESDIENRFSIDVQAYWSSGGPTFSFGKNTFTGTLSTYVDVHDALEDNSFTGRIILYQNGKEIAEQPLEYRSQGGEYGANIYDTEVRLGSFDGRMSDFSIKVEITDAYGRVFTVSPIKQAKNPQGANLLSLWDNFLLVFGLFGFSRLSLCRLADLLIQILLELAHEVRADHLVGDRLAVKDLLERFAVHGLVADKVLRDARHRVHVLAQQLLALMVSGLDDAVDLIVDLRRLDLRVALACGEVAAEEDLASLRTVVDGADLVAHAVARDHRARHLGGLLVTP